MICAEVLYDRLPQLFMLQRVFINDTEIVSHTQAVAKIISDTQQANAITHWRVDHLLTKAGDN